MRQEAQEFLAGNEADRRTALRLELAYPDTQSFIERYAGNLSLGGVFLPTREPLPPGTRLRFEIVLLGGHAVLRGEGEVAWSAPPDPARPERPYGLGVRLSRLDAESRQVLERALAYRAAHPDRFSIEAPDPFATAAYGYAPALITTPATPALPASSRSLPPDAPGSSRSLRTTRPGAASASSTPGSAVPPGSAATPSRAPDLSELEALRRPKSGAASPSPSMSPEEAARRLRDLLSS